MSVLAILEVAIGIIFVWFVLSVLVSTVQEAIANIFHWRGKGLEQAIHQLLDDPDLQKRLQIPLDGSRVSSLSRTLRRLFRRPQPATAPVANLAGAAAVAPSAQAGPVTSNAIMAGGATVAGADSGTVSMSGRATQLVPLGTKFYEHPLIRSLGQDITKRRPSYIPAGQFAEVVFDIVVEAGSPASPLRKAADRAEQDLQEAKDEVQKSAERAWRALLRRVEGLPQAKALDEALAKSIDEQAVDLIQKYPFLEPAVAELKSAIGFPPLLSQLRAGIDALQVQSPQFAQTLGILVTRAIQNTRGADEALAKARGNVEAWFDNSMQRLSGAYKRRVQLYAFMIGLMVALVANVDSVAILRTLWSDQGVRSALTVQAQQTIQAGQGAAGEQTADQILNLLGALRLPLGWTLITAAQDIADDTRCSDFYGSFYRARTCFYPASYDTATAVYRATVWQTVFGILLTAIATLQGSPFWFGVLSKIVNLRASTPPPAAQPVK